MADIRVIHGDMREQLRVLRDDGVRVQSIVTDPPYGLEFMGKEWDAPWKYGMNAYGMKDTKGRAAGPSFTSARNPMCKKCRKHKRGSKSHQPCVCAEPQFDETEHRLRDMAAFQAWFQECAELMFDVLVPGGHCLVFGGTRTYHRTGTTGMACMAEGFDCILVEREAEYVADIRARIAHVHGDDTPLFAVAADD